MSLGQTFLAVFLASLLGFGGLGSLPVLRGQLASAGLMPDQLLLSSLAVGNISPGPNGLYLIAVGYFVRGYAGAGVATLAVLLPPLLVLLLGPVRVGSGVAEPGRGRAARAVGRVAGLDGGAHLAGRGHARRRRRAAAAAG